MNRLLKAKTKRIDATYRIRGVDLQNKRNTFFNPSILRKFENINA